jgi:hypothetical protein
VTRRRVVFAAAFVAALAAAAPRAEAHRWHRNNIGVGLVLGEPTGLTLDIRPNHWSSFEIDLGLGTFEEEDSGYAHLTYQVRFVDLTHRPRLSVPLYLGVGIFFSDHARDFEDGHVGVRFPFGIAFEFRPPIQIFAEIALQVFLVDIGHDHSHDLDIDGALGFRLYF